MHGEHKSFAPGKHPGVQLSKCSPDRGQPLSLQECCNNVTDPVSNAAERNLLLHIVVVSGLQPQLPYLLALRSCSNADAFMKPLQAGALQALL